MRCFGGKNLSHNQKSSHLWFDVIFIVYSIAFCQYSEVKIQRKRGPKWQSQNNTIISAHVVILSEIDPARWGDYRAQQILLSL